MSFIFRVPSGATDPHFSSVVALLHMDTNFADVKGKSWSSVAGASISAAQYKFGGGSGSFNGTTQYVEGVTHADWAFNTADFTVECWARLTAYPGSQCSPLGNWTYSSGWALAVTASGALIWDTAAGTKSSAASAVSLATWNHLAYSRNSGTGRLFVNGVVVHSSGDTYNHYATDPVRIGNDRSGWPMWNGFVDDVRITKGVGRYTSNFAVRTTAFPNTA